MKGAKTHPHNAGAVSVGLTSLPWVGAPETAEGSLISMSDSTACPLLVMTTLNLGKYDCKRSNAGRSMGLKVFSRTETTKTQRSGNITESINNDETIEHLLRDILSFS